MNFTQHTKTHVLICAAGQGLRAGTALPKQYELINGVPMLVHTILAFGRSSVVQEISVVIAPDDEWFDERVAPWVGADVAVLRVGGETRARSVCNALAELDSGLNGVLDDAWLMVHDAARPCVRGEAIERLFETVVKSNAVGGLLALPVVDTVKLSDDGKLSKKTLNRTKLWAAQTPQMFKLDVLYNALSDALVDVSVAEGLTDEASVMEWAGISPLLVMGDVSNLKVTHPHDFLLAAFWLNQLSPRNDLIENVLDNA